MKTYNILYAVVIEPGYDVRYRGLSLLMDAETSSLPRVDRALEEAARKGIDEQTATYLPDGLDELIPVEVFGVVDRGFKGPAAFSIGAPSGVDLKNPGLGYVTPLDDRQVDQLREILYGRSFSPSSSVYLTLLTNKGLFPIFSPFFPRLRVVKEVMVTGSRFEVKEVWLK